MEAKCKQEIIELHQFFQDWFRSKLEDSDHEFNRFARVLAQEFTMIAPSGSLNHREAILGMVRHGHGSWRERNGRIWIENVVTRWQDADMCLVTYEEWQENDELVTARLSTVLFRERFDTPHGVEWVHLHETWLPTAEA